LNSRPDYNTFLGGDEGHTRILSDSEPFSERLGYYYLPLLGNFYVEDSSVQVSPTRE